MGPDKTTKPTMANETLSSTDRREALNEVDRKAGHGLISRLCFALVDWWRGGQNAFTSSLWTKPIAEAARRTAGELLIVNRFCWKQIGEGVNNQY